MTELETLISQTPLLVAYFSHNDCSVCRVMKPKVEELLKTHYPNAIFCYVNTHEQPAWAAQQSVFTVPTVIGYVLGKETFRLSRNFAIAELGERIDRIYPLLFDK
ncbi:MAG: thioredoxin family protein [Marinilabiliaceae bacterium]|nr:thioredoxin family protein [Marinilabiliaceae bacterium]